jgi:rhodanese-related sulfurtransferase
MVRTVTRQGLNERLANDGLTLVEVLDAKQYRKFHLPGAISVPLDEHFDQQIQKAVPDKSRTVVLYCMNAECEASSKAGRRMDELGYQQVFDYEAGKVDWQEAGLPVEK